MNTLVPCMSQFVEQPLGRLHQIAEFIWRYPRFLEGLLDSVRYRSMAEGLVAQNVYLDPKWLCLIFVNALKYPNVASDSRASSLSIFKSDGMLKVSSLVSYSL